VSAAEATPVSAAEAADLLAPVRNARGLVLAVSGGPDSTALLWLAARWRHSLRQGPTLLAVTVDHGLRPEARAEADAVKRLAKRCGVAHRTMRWSGCKPASGLQQAARAARYRLLAEAAGKIGADYILTGHTLDDQAETLLIRMSRGSGITGLAGMTQIAPVPGQEGITLVRPFLGVAKSRLIATLAEAGLDFADDPSNRDPRYTRSRVRALMPALAREGLGSERLSQLARRLQRAEAALVAATDAAWTKFAREQLETVAFDPAVAALPEEVQVRLIGRAVARVGNEGPAELGKLERLHAALASAAAGGRVRRTLAGAIVTREGNRFTVAPAPARRTRRTKSAVRGALNHRPTLLPQSGQTAVE
jgi:tRNA(Ile)-lysidine synthase